ncbi:MAG: acyl-CoA dehydrogenase family protein, partial [Rhodospirillaceae bacterium]
MDFSLPKELEDLRRRVGAFVADEIMPVEADPANFDAHENIAEAPLQDLRGKAKAAGLWAPQMPTERGGLGLNTVGMAVFYEEAARSRFGPVVFNCAAPDDGNMILLDRVAREDQK